MTKRKYEQKCKALFVKAEERGVKLDFDPSQFDCNRLNCLWYGGWYASIEITPQIHISIGVYGDVRAWLFDKKGEQLAYAKDKGNNGRFYDEMSYYIKNDKQLEKIIKKGYLTLDNNNWVEYGGVIYPEGYDNGGLGIDLGMLTDNILDDDVLEAIDQVLDDLVNIVEEIKYYTPNEYKGVVA